MRTALLVSLAVPFALAGCGLPGGGGEKRPVVVEEIPVARVSVDVSGAYGKTITIDAVALAPGACWFLDHVEVKPGRLSNEYDVKVFGQRPVEGGCAEKPKELRVLERIEVEQVGELTYSFHVEGGEVVRRTVRAGWGGP